MTLSREARRLYQREYRARKAAEAAPEPLRLVPDDHAGPVEARGVRVSMESLVLLELAEYDRVPMARWAAIIACARVLDTPAAVPQHSLAAGRLDGLMELVRAGKSKQRTGLAGLRAARGAS